MKCLRAVAWLLIIVVLAFEGCVPSFYENEYVYFTGRIVDGAGNPIEGISVKITNGNAVQDEDVSYSDGRFNVHVLFSSINEQYYILLEDAFGTSKQAKLRGLGAYQYDFGEIVFYDNEMETQLPMITIGYVTNTTYYSTTIKAVVEENSPYPVLERGFCVSSTSNPTIDNYEDIYACGAGTGSFTYVIDWPNLANRPEGFYIRAYAKTDKGTSYSVSREVSRENLNYEELPTMSHAGKKYHIYQNMGTMTWQNAYNACEELEYAGYDDWYLPSIEELKSMPSDITGSLTLWSQTQYGNTNQHYYLYKTSTYSDYDDEMNDVIAVRHD